MPDMQASRLGQQMGEYLLVRKLGGGSFGTVYLAEHVQKHIQVAVKVLHTPLVKDKDFKDFINEARTIRLRHPHIVPLLQFGTNHDGLPFLVMEYAPGTLQDRHPKGKHLALSTIVSYVNQIASALQYAHDQHVIHRDVKPANILVRTDGTLMVSDFGIAKFLEQSALTSVQTQVGTPAYMAPEQHIGHPCFASDQYALAVMIYEWICGVRPFQGTALGLAVQHMNTPVTLLRDHVPELSEAVESVVLKALAKAPEDRFERIQEFADALCEAVQSSPDETSTTVPLIPAEPERQTVVTNLTSPSPEPSPLPQSLSWRWSRRMLLFAGTVLIGGGVSWFAVSQRKDAPLPPPIPTHPKGTSTPLPPETSQFIYKGHSGEVTSASWSPDGKRIASSSADGTVQVWDSLTGEHVLVYRGHTGAVGQAVWSPDGAKIASGGGSQETVQEWDALMGKSIFAYNTKPAYGNDIAWSRDGKYLAIGVVGPGTHEAGPPQKGDLVQIWDVTSRQMVRTYAYYFPEGIAWSPDGKYLAVNSTFGETTIIDIATGDSSISHSGFMNSMRSVVWSPDGRYVASASDNGTIHVWEPKGSPDQAIYVFGIPHSGSMSAVSWSPNGKRIASGSEDGHVQVWDALTGENLTIYKGHIDVVTSVQWSPDGRFVLSGSNDHTVRLWEAS